MSNTRSPQKIDGNPTSLGLLRWLLAHTSPSPDGEFVLAEIDAEVERLRRSQGEETARQWYRRQLLVSLLPLAAFSIRLKAQRGWRMVKRMRHPSTGAIWRWAAVSTILGLAFLGNLRQPAREPHMERTSTPASLGQAPQPRGSAASGATARRLQIPQQGAEALAVHIEALERDFETLAERTEQLESVEHAATEFPRRFE